jgi:hypothetical protein
MTNVIRGLTVVTIQLCVCFVFLSHLKWCVHQVMCTPSDVYTKWCVHQVICTPSDVYTKCTPSDVYAKWCVRQVMCTPSDVYAKWCVHQVMCTPSDVYTKWCVHHVLFIMQGNTFTVLTLFVPFAASDNRVQYPSWTVVSDSVVKDHTCGGKIFSPHASDCHKYYLCQFGVLIEQTCPAGLYWNKVNCRLIDNELPVFAVMGRKDQGLLVISLHLLSIKCCFVSAPLFARITCRWGQRGEMEIELLPICILPPEGGGDQCHTPTTLPKRKTRYLLYWRLGGP